LLFLDSGDRGCVQLLLELRTLIAHAERGTTIHVRTDPAAPLDLAAWCHLTGHTCLGPVDTDIADTGTASTYALQVTDHAAATRPDHPWRPVRTDHHQPANAH
jgi:tRNA 2-thiouridine synthesizing protein A